MQQGESMGKIWCLLLGSLMRCSIFGGGWDVQALEYALWGVLKMRAQCVQGGGGEKSQKFCVHTMGMAPCGVQNKGM